MEYLTAGGAKRKWAGTAQPRANPWERKGESTQGNVRTVRKDTVQRHIPWSIHLITRLHCSALWQYPFQNLAYYGFCWLLTVRCYCGDSTACETSRDKPASLSSSTCLIYAHGLRLPLGLRCVLPAYPPCTPYIRFLSVKLRFRYPFFSPHLTM